MKRLLSHFEPATPSGPELAGALIVLAVLSLGAHLAGCARDEAAPPAPAAPPPQQLAGADVATAARGTIESGPLISGTLEPARGAQVNAQLGGTVRAIGPELGDTVARGALLARLDPGSLGAAAASAKAQVTSAARGLDVARREVERTRALVEAGAVPRRELEQAEARLAQQEAATDLARSQLAASADQLADATVRSPIDGVVAKRSVNAGDVVAPGAPLYHIIDPSSLRLAASVPSDELGALAAGKQVRFTVRGYPGEELAGTVSRVAPAADPQTRQIPILIEIPNPSRRLLAGLFAQGRIATRTATGLAIPASAVDAATTPPTVLRVTTGTVERVPVTLGLRDPLRDRVLVTRGLADGDRVLVRAAAAPAPGTRVTIEATAPPPQPPKG